MLSVALFALLGAAGLATAFWTRPNIGWDHPLMVLAVAGTVTGLVLILIEDRSWWRRLGDPFPPPATPCQWSSDPADPSIVWVAGVVDEVTWSTT